jgi:hypothetical protein
MRWFGVAYVDAPDQRARAAVDINARLRGLGTSVGEYLVLVAVYGCSY